MEYLKSVWRAINYIEQNLTNDIDVSIIARESGYSYYHFERIFKGILGDSLMDYIRKRRITEAAKDLVNTDMLILDIAIKYGYGSREAFTRAFERVFGRRVSEVRNDGIVYSIRERIDMEYLSFEHTRMNRGMDPSIVEFDDMKVVGERYRIIADGSNYKEIPLLWSRWQDESREAHIKGRKNDRNMGICIPLNGVKMDYMIGCEVAYDIDDISKYMDVYSIEGGTYAVFKTIGPITESVQKTWDYIYARWLYVSEYEHRGGEDIEIYYYHDNKLCADICIPVVEKCKELR